MQHSMGRRWRGAAMAALLICSAQLAALGLGPIDVRSHLNEPFEARIPIIGAGPDDSGLLAAFLADPAQFRKADLPRPFVLARLQFTIEDAPGRGPQYVRVTSAKPIREPALDFLLELASPRTRLVQHYTVLLDPAPDPRSAAPRPARPVPIDTGGDPGPTADPGPTPPAPEAQPAAGPPGDPQAGPHPAPDPDAPRTYGPVRDDDTLWSVAARLRPDDSVSVQQMMLGLWRANPQAFSGGSLHGLRRGAMLTVPPRSEITRLSPQQAFEEVRRRTR